jgi:hypothetical protein
MHHAPTSNPTIAVVVAAIAVVEMIAKIEC